MKNGLEWKYFSVRIYTKDKAQKRNVLKMYKYVDNMKIYNVV